ncbi:MAG: hypothetical protein U1E45_11490 [Geminicoccaceae bacterium]
MIDRRSVLGQTAVALLGLFGGTLPAWASDIRSLALYQRFGKPSLSWDACDLLQPVLERRMGVPVSVATDPGDHGLAAIDAVLDRPADEPALVITAVMGPQYAETVLKPRVRLAELTPIAKLTNGYSVLAFARPSGTLKAWSDLAGHQPLSVSSIELSTSPFVATVMMEKVGGLRLDVKVRQSLADVMNDVIEGRSDVGVLPTPVAVDHLDKLHPLATFGAKRNLVLAADTPTFAEIVGNPKVAFTESIAVFAAPGLDPALAGRLTAAVLSAGKDDEAMDRVESWQLPIALNGPDVLTETIDRNTRVLKRILAG